MPAIINTNIASINAQRNLAKSQGALQTSLQRLSSGLRINSAKDDAAGLAISNRFTTQVRGLNVAVRNANDGISLAQTTESALDEITNSLQRIRDLAVQAANDTNSTADRVSLQEEVNQLVSEIDRIASTTTFNGRKVLNGSVDEYSFQIGANAGENVIVKGVDARISALGSQPGQVQSTFAIDASVGNINSFTVAVAGGGGPVIFNDILQQTVADLQDTTQPNYGRGLAKDLASRINLARENRDNGFEDLANVYASAKTSYSYLDVDTANPPADASAYVTAGNIATGDLVINGIDIGPVSVQEKDADGALVDAINAKSSLTGFTANLDSQGRLQLVAEDGRDLVLDAVPDAVAILFSGATDGYTHPTLTAQVKSGDITLSSDRTITGPSDPQFTAVAENVQATGTIAASDITTVSGANTTIKSIDSALSQIDSFRGTLGAIQNRFESTIRNLSSISESLSAANSRIKDADFALESANLSKNQVLQQAGNSILAQANALPQQVLSLLQG